MQITCRSHADHMQITCRSHAGHMQITCRSHACHSSTDYTPHFLSPFLLQTPFVFQLQTYSVLELESRNGKSKKVEGSRDEGRIGDEREEKRKGEKEKRRREEERMTCLCQRAVQIH